MLNQEITSRLKLTALQKKALQEAHLIYFRDVVLDYPLRYEDHTKVTAIQDLNDGEPALIWAKVVRATTQSGKGREILKATIQDDSGEYAQITHFNFYPALLNAFQAGRSLILYGKPKWDNFRQIYDFSHPKITWLDDAQIPQLPTTITPIYWGDKIKPALRNKILEAFFNEEALHQPFSAQLTGDCPDYAHYSFAEALQIIHSPKDLNVIPLAKKRIALEELLNHRQALLLKRLTRENQEAVPLPKQALVEEILANLPYQLTAGQKSALWEIQGDLSQNRPMFRLLQGDVGAGKTVVALLACVQAIANGKQAVLLVPTEILAEQHYASAEKLFGTKIQTVLLTGKNKKALPEIENGTAQLIIGTHAVFQEKVQYHDLALMVIDEQHRFGVAQREHLQHKAKQHLHQLVMTATPIPRSLAQTQFGDLALSVIGELPPNRLPIITTLLPAERREALIRRVGVNCRNGRQAYWICPLIEDQAESNKQNVQRTINQLTEALPDLKIAQIHGQTPQAERQAIMNDFKNGEIQILVSTTVIEVGVDVANASLILIEHAERFGLAQLHQLRGRVGRGTEQSYCVLIYQQPLTEIAETRLQLMTETQDGFRLAEADLSLRGAGDLLGENQSGEALFYAVEFPRDEPLLDDLKKINILPEYQLALSQRWQKNTMTENT